MCRPHARAPLGCLLGWLLLSGPAARADLTLDSDPASDLEVTVSLDAAAESGRARASELIHARPEVIAGLIRSCSETLKIVPGLSECRVLASAPDGSWQIVRQVEEHWLLPKLTYDFRCTWENPRRVRMERVGGDLRVLEGSWQLDPDHDGTRVHYDVDVAPGFWVPHWMVKLALRHDLPKMLRALRSRAETLELEQRATASASSASLPGPLP